MDILLSLLAVLDVAGEEAEALCFWERVTALLVISVLGYSGRQRLIESLLVRVREVWASPEWYIASSDSMLKSPEEAYLVLICSGWVGSGNSRLLLAILGSLRLISNRPGVPSWILTR